MPEQRVTAETQRAAGAPAELRGIHAVRRSLGLGEAEAELVRAAGRRLSGEVEDWVDRFYLRLLTDPVARDLLKDEARVVRLKRSLSAWFHEIFSLPFDEHYERARAAIGNTHVRIAMPPYLMVTAMSGIRQDVTASALRSYANEPEAGAAAARALSLALDMELALMLEAYRRRDRSQARNKDRAIYTERAVRRMAYGQRDRLDAALCYLELACRSAGGTHPPYLDRVLDVLHGLYRSGQPLRAQQDLGSLPLASVRLADLCTLALDNVALDDATTIDIDIEPTELAADLRADGVRLALEEVLQNAVKHAPGSRVRLTARPGRPQGSAAVVLEVTDEGPGWAPHIERVQDIYLDGGGLSLSFCELVAELHGGALEIFRPPGGGAGVRLTLGRPSEPAA